MSSGFLIIFTGKLEEFVKAAQRAEYQYIGGTLALSATFHVNAPYATILLYSRSEQYQGGADEGRR